MTDTTVDAGAPAPAGEPIASTPVIDTNPAPVGSQENLATDTSQEPETPPTIDETLEAAWNKVQTGQERGPDGKFISANGKAPEATPETPAPPPAPAVEPPNSWNAEAKAEWSKLPPSTQSYILQRESEAHKAITEYGQKLKNYEPLDQTISKYKADFERRGMDAVKATEMLYEAQRLLDANPADGLIRIAQTYGIDLRPAFQGQAAQALQQHPELQQLQQRLARTEQEIAQQRQAAEEAQQAEADATLKEFSKDKPYFQEVRKLMASFYRDGHADTLQAAYDMAVNASPTVRTRIQEDQRKAAEAKREAEAKAKAAEAQKSARVNVRSDAAAKSNPTTIDDTLAAIAKKHYG